LDPPPAKPNLESSPIVYVHWVDAVADNGWEDVSKAAVHDCHTVGYLIDETKEAICLASTVSIDTSNARMHIPTAWIKKRKVLTLETKLSKSKRKSIPAVGTRSNTSQVLS
jgi:hypothetical protein